MTYSNACLWLFFVSNQRPASFALLSRGVYLRPRLFAANQSSSCSRASFEKSFQFFSENEPPKLWNDVLVTIWVPAQAKFQLRLGSVPIQLLPAFRDLVFLHIRFCKFTQRNTVKTRFTDTRVIRTPHYYRQFTLFLGKENPYIFSKFNPLISIAPTPSPSVRIKGGGGGGWLYSKQLLWRKQIQTLFSSCGSREGCPGGRKKCFCPPPP